MINKDHIGDFVVRIVSDPRTLNQYVFVHEAEVSQKEIYEICSLAAGEDFWKLYDSVTQVLPCTTYEAGTVQITLTELEKAADATFDKVWQ